MIVQGILLIAMLIAVTATVIVIVPYIAGIIHKSRSHRLHRRVNDLQAKKQDGGQVSDDDVALLMSELSVDRYAHVSPERKRQILDILTSSASVKESSNGLQPTVGQAHAPVAMPQRALVPSRISDADSGKAQVSSHTVAGIPKDPVVSLNWRRLIEEIFEPVLSPSDGEQGQPLPESEPPAEAESSAPDVEVAVGTRTEREALDEQSPISERERGWVDLYERLIHDPNDASAVNELMSRIQIWARGQSMATGAFPRDLIEDIVVDTTSSVVLSLHEARERRTFNAFVYRHYLNIRNRVLRAHRPSVSLADLQIPDSTSSLPDHDELDVLAQALAELPERERLAVGLCYINELPLSEVARVLDVSHSSARLIAHRGLVHLRKKMLNTWAQGRG